MSSLRGRLALRLVGGLGICILAGDIFLAKLLESRVLSDFDRALASKVEAVASLAEQADGKIWLELDEAEIAEFHLGGEYFDLRGEDGRLVAQTSSLASALLAPTSTRGGNEPEAFDLQLPDGRPGRGMRFEFEPRPEYDEVHGETAAPPATDGAALLRASIVVARERRSLDIFLLRLRQSLLIFSALLLGAAALLVDWTLRRQLAPIARLGQRLAAMDAETIGDPTQELGLPAEIRPLAARLVELLARLKATLERERSFSRHLAHELRTPLAELRTASEVALRWPEDRAGLVSALEESRAIGLQLERVVTNLLGLARLESGTEAGVVDTIPLHALVEDLLRGVGRAAAARGVTLRNSVGAGIAIESAEGTLRLALVNLIANAVEYAPEGTWLEVVFRDDGSVGTISVSNPAPGLFAADLEGMFERFWQKDRSRSSGEHAGLGLTLVRAAASALALELRSVLDGDQVLTISLTGLKTVTADRLAGPPVAASA